MRAAVMHHAGDVRIETVPDPVIQQPTDAVVRVVAGCICGSDLWPYASMAASETARRMGHEFVGVVEETGAEVSGVAVGDFVIAPFVASDGTCDFCREGLQTSCRHGAHWGGANDGGQGDRVRVPQADGTLVVVPAGFDQALIPSLLALSDVMSTGYHAAVTGGVAPARAYIPTLLPLVLDGTIEPGRVFDRTVDLDGVPDGYRAMADREALKVLVRP